MTFSSLADIQADIAIVSAGLFAGLPGGIGVGFCESSLRRRSRTSAASRCKRQSPTQTIASLLEQGLPMPSRDGATP